MCLQLEMSNILLLTRYLLVAKGSVLVRLPALMENQMPCPVYVFQTVGELGVDSIHFGVVSLQPEAAYSPRPVTSRFNRTTTTVTPSVRSQLQRFARVTRAHPTG